MIQIEEKNGNYYFSDGDVNIQCTDKNSLIKAVAGCIGVSILTSDEFKNSVSSAPLEKTEWDTGTVTHDGIQFNRHFIDVSKKLDKVISAFEGFVMGMQRELSTIESRIKAIEQKII